MTTQISFVQGGGEGAHGTISSSIALAVSQGQRTKNNKRRRASPALVKTQALVQQTKIAIPRRVRESTDHGLCVDRTEKKRQSVLDRNELQVESVGP